MPSQVGELLAFLTACYPAWTPPENTLRAWSRLLDDANHESLMASATAYAKAHKWPPSVAELLLGTAAVNAQATVTLCTDCRSKPRAPGRALCDACATPRQSPLSAKAAADIAARFGRSSQENATQANPGDPGAILK